MLDNLPNRAALAKAIGASGLKKGAEIGVLDGDYSEVLCRNIPDLHLICVDTWKPSRNHVRATNLERSLRRAKLRLEPYGAVFMRMTSLEAAAIVPNDTLDFVYIDALHDFENVTMDLTAWVPKVRKGGLIAGHDWTHRDVTAAVNAYAATHHVPLIHSTAKEPEDWYPSWCWIK